MNKQLGSCQANQGRLEQDLENKDVALDIDHTCYIIVMIIVILTLIRNHVDMMTMMIPRCHNIHNNSKDIQLHGGIERQARGQKNLFSIRSRKRWIYF